MGTGCEKKSGGGFTRYQSYDWSSILLLEDNSEHHTPKYIVKVEMRERLIQDQVSSRLQYTDVFLGWKWTKEIVDWTLIELFSLHSIQ